MKTRREALISIAAATPAAAQAPPHAHPGHDDTGAGGKPKNTRPKALSSQELDALAELAEIIIPRSDTPGARDARVHWIIDSVLASQRNLIPAFRDGLKPFLALGESAKRDRMSLLHHNKDPFFRMLKDMTVDAYYSTREGLVQELGWSGYTPQTEFKGCTHPEHQGKQG